MSELPPSVDRATRRFTTWQQAEAAAKMRLPPAVRDLYKQVRCEQKTEEWLVARHDAITASDFGAAVKLNPYSSQNELIRKKSDPNFPIFTGSAATRHGELYEDCALHIYETELVPGAFTLDFGLLSHVRLFDQMPSETIGDFEKMRHYFLEVHRDEAMKRDWTWLKGSPDGVALVPQPDGSVKAVLLEIKCPFKNFYAGKIAQYYYAQVQLLMHLLDLDECHFVQYQPAHEPFFDRKVDLQVVVRNREWMAAAKEEARHVWHIIQQRRAAADDPSAVTVDTVRTNSGVDNLKRLLTTLPANAIDPKRQKRVQENASTTTAAVQHRVKVEDLDFVE